MAEETPRTPDEVFAEIRRHRESRPHWRGPSSYVALAEHEERLAGLWLELFAAADDAPGWAHDAVSAVAAAAAAEARHWRRSAERAAKGGEPG